MCTIVVDVPWDQVLKMDKLIVDYKENRGAKGQWQKIAEYARLKAGKSMRMELRKTERSS